MGADAAAADLMSSGTTRAERIHRLSLGTQPATAGLLTHNGLLKSSVPSSDCSAFPCRPETREPMKGSTRGIPTARPCRVFGPLGPLRVSTLTPHEQQVVIQPPIFETSPIADVFIVLARHTRSGRPFREGQLSEPMLHG